MSVADCVRLMLLTSIFLVVFGLGMKAKGADIAWFLRQPRLLWKSLLSMYLVLPLFAIGFLSLFELTRPVFIGLGLLALSPVPPFLPANQLKAGGEAAYVFGLLFTTAVTAIVVVPLVLWLLGQTFDFPTMTVFGPIVKVVLLTVLIPLFGGAILRRFFPSKMERWALPVGTVGMVLLMIGILPVLVREWPAMMSLVGNGTILAMIATAVVGLFAGHLLGGPVEGNRSSLALATAARHPGVALAVGGADFPGQTLLPAAVLLYLIVSLLVSMPYKIWRKRGGNLSLRRRPKLRPRFAE